MTQDVKDKIVERGINVSVIVQTLLLAATIGFGTRIVNSIDTLTTQVSKLVTTTQVNRSEINHNLRRIEHIEGDVSEIKLVLKNYGVK